MNSKLKNELDTLLENKVISPKVASDINNYYDTLPKKTDRIFTIFGVLGATLVGLGIVLIVAHNWDTFSKGIKTFFAFLPLVVGQLFAGFSILKKKSNTWKESSGIFLFFSIGACISLVAQIYNIPGSLSNFLLTWILISTPLMYILRSKSLAVLHIGFATYYALQHGYSLLSNTGTPWYYLLLFAIVLPFYFLILKEDKKSNLSTIFSWMLPLSLMISLGSFINKGEEFGYLLYMLLFGLFYNISQGSIFKNMKVSQNGYLFLGSLGTLVVSILLSFKFLWSGFKFESFQHQEFYIGLGLFLANTVLIGSSLLKTGRKEFTLNSIAPFLFVLLFFVAQTNIVVARVVTNLFLLLWGVILIHSGVKKLHFGLSNYGLLIITILIICRFFDTDISFVLRGVLFLVVGVGFFATNYVMHKKLKK